MGREAMSEALQNVCPSEYVTQDGACFAALLNADKWEEAEEEIRALSRLEAGWCDDGSDPISVDLIHSALALAADMKNGDRPAPDSVYAMPDGNIMFEWHAPE